MALEEALDARRARACGSASRAFVVEEADASSSSSGFGGLDAAHGGPGGEHGAFEADERAQQDADAEDGGAAAGRDECHTCEDTEPIVPRNLETLFASQPALPRKRAGPPAGAKLGVVAGAAHHHQHPQESLEQLQVVLRVRPPPRNAPEPACVVAESQTSIAIVAPQTSNAYKAGDRGSTYRFSRAFGPAATQAEFFDAVAAPLVRALAGGRRESGVVMTYGITSAGKTYTIEGTRQEPGMLYRSLDLLFEELASDASAAGVELSYYEVYNEQVFDLLVKPTAAPMENQPAPRRVPLRLKEAEGGHVFVDGLSAVPVDDSAAAVDVLRRGGANRRRAQTQLNAASSRSHAVVTIMVHRSDTEAPGWLSFVDLAGSERAARTQHAGAALKESISINSSLMTLSRCLATLRYNQQHPNEKRPVPYRESKITHLFRDMLHGWGRLTLVVNVSASPKDYDETTHVLKYATIATDISIASRADHLMPAAYAPGGAAAALERAAKRVRGAGRLGEAVSRSCAVGEPSGSGAALADVEAERDALLAQVHELQRELASMRYRAEREKAEVETRVRAEVSAEVSDLIKDLEVQMEERCRQQQLGHAQPTPAAALGGTRYEEEEEEEEEDLGPTPKKVLPMGARCESPVGEELEDDEPPTVVKDVSSRPELVGDQEESEVGASPPEAPVAAWSETVAEPAAEEDEPVVTAAAAQKRQPKRECRKQRALRRSRVVVRHSLGLSQQELKSSSPGMIPQPAPADELPAPADEPTAPVEQPPAAKQQPVERARRNPRRASTVQPPAAATDRYGEGVLSPSDAGEKHPDNETGDAAAPGGDTTASLEPLRMTVERAREEALASALRSEKKAKPTRSRRRGRGSQWASPPPEPLVVEELEIGAVDEPIPASESPVQPTGTTPKRRAVAAVEAVGPLVAEEEEEEKEEPTLVHEQRAKKKSLLRRGKEAAIAMVRGTPREGTHDGKENVEEAARGAAAKRKRGGVLAAVTPVARRTRRGAANA